MAKKEYRIELSYPGKLYTIAFDDKLRKAVGRTSDGSGLGFVARDISWTFKIKTAAVSGFERLRKFLAQKGFRFAKTFKGVSGKGVLLTLWEVDTETCDDKVVKTACTA